MRQTQKYRKACETLTFPHSIQEELYQELNRLGFFWDSRQQTWERNEQLAEPPSKLVRIRVWAASSKVVEAASVIAEALAPYGLRLQEKSEPYICRPPQNNDSRVYLTFTDEDD